MARYASTIGEPPFERCPACGSKYVLHIKRHGALRILPRTTLHECDDCGAEYLHLLGKLKVRCNWSRDSQANVRVILDEKRKTEEGLLRRRSLLDSTADKPQSETAVSDGKPAKPDTSRPVEIAPPEPPLQPASSTSPSADPAAAGITADGAQKLENQAASPELPVRRHTSRPKPEKPVVSHVPQVSALPAPVEDVAITRKEVETYFSLTSSPFSTAPDPNYIYYSKNYQKVFSQVWCAIQDRQGYIAISGDIGCGKTTMCRLLLSKAGGIVNTALIINPNLSELQLLVAIVEDFGITITKRDRKTCLDALNTFLAEQWRKGGTSVLIIDEAQNMSVSTLESVRVLSNFETNETKLLQTILVGQPELRDTLMKDSMTQLRQRVSTWCHLTPFTRDEMAEYIAHRLKTASADGKIVFTPEALDVVFDYSSGTPRLVNVLCDKIMKFACFHTTGNVSREIAASARSTMEVPVPQLQVPASSRDVVRSRT